MVQSILRSFPGKARGFPPVCYSLPLATEREVSAGPLVLVTNDDGFDAPGLHALVEALHPLGRIVVVAPDREQSASAHALTLRIPLRVYQAGRDRWRVEGTPTDCV